MYIVSLERDKVYRLFAENLKNKPKTAVSNILYSWHRTCVVKLKGGST